MKRVIMVALSFLLIFCLFGCSSDEKGPKADGIGETDTDKSISSIDPMSDDSGDLRYDGLYCYINDLDNDGFIDNYVMRFYEDGVVINVSIEQSENSMGYFPHETWFNRESKLLGSYELSGGDITFTTVGENGTVDYWGEVMEDCLVLDSHSNINGFENFDKEYVFYPFEDVPGWYD